MTVGLNEQLQARLDTFHHKFGKDAEMDDNRIWLVTNLNKPEHERIPHTINGSVISRFVFDGYYDIQFVGFAEPMNTSERLEARRQKALQEAEKLKEQFAGPSPSPKKVEQKKE